MMNGLSRRRRVPSALVLPALVILASGLSGCDGSTDDPPPARSTEAHPSDSPEPSTPATPDIELPQVLELRDDLIDLRPVEWVGTDWEGWELVDDQTVRLSIFAGRAACYGAEATVVESEDNVHISLQLGWIPDAGTCTMDLVSSTVDIALERPLGDRTVTLAD